MTEAATTDLTRVTQAYINVRDARAELKAEFERKDEELKAALAKIEAVMLQHLNKSNMDAVRTEAGTFYRQVDLKPSCSDWGALNKWVVENDAWDVYERRLKKTFIAQFMEAHDDMLPPGVNVHREYVCRVRRG